MPKLVAPKETRLPPIRPNAGVTEEYRKRIAAMIARMQADVLREIRETYTANPPEMAADASPAAELLGAIGRLRKRWEAAFATFAHVEARRFAASATGHAQRSLKATLRKAGFSVKFQMTRAANDAIQATIGEQVGLIKSIASEELGRVQGAVMRSVQAGRDVGGLAKELEQTFGVTKRRAAFIAGDQNSKATATITRVRQIELGITEAIWLHSAGGKTPRASHVKASREKTRFYTAKGWYDPHEEKFIFPGELPRCRCVSISVIPGLKT